MMDSDLLGRYWALLTEKIPGVRLKVLQAIAPTAVGSTDLRRSARPSDVEADRRYRTAVGLFLYSDEDKRDIGVNTAQRSLASCDPSPNVYGWWDLTGEPQGFYCPEHRLAGFASQASGEPTTDIVPWESTEPDDPQSVVQLWYEALSSQFDNGDWTCWVSLKVPVRSGSGQMTLRATAYAVGCDGIKNASDRIKLARILNELLAESVIEVHEAEVERQARSASLSQVLSRTMSHNLGSHSLNAFATEDGMRKQFEEIECRKRTKACIPGRIVERDAQGQEVVNCTPATEACVKSAGSYIPCSQQEAEDLSKHRRVLLARYNNYLRERMDFLADITTAVPAFETRTHFVQDLLKGYAENHLLTTTIAGSPVFDYQWDPKIYTKKNDILVSIPSDVLGRHAAFVIMENIVRNSSKHGAHDKLVTYSVKVKEVRGDKHGDMLRVTIMDDKPRATTNMKEGEVGYKGSVNELIVERNADINRPVLENGRVRNGAWGMLEMKACAAYLRRVPLENLDEEQYHAHGETDEQLALRKELPLLEAVGDEHGFGYAFYLMRPKDVMVVGERVEELFGGGITKDVLAECGIGFKTQDEWKANPLVAHSLLLLSAPDRDTAIAFLVQALNDPAALPHEILLCSGAWVEDTTIEELLKEAVAAVLRLAEPPVEHHDLKHRSSLLCDAVKVLGRNSWDLLAEKPAKLSLRLRHHWIIEWMKARKYGVNSSTNFQPYIRRIMRATPGAAVRANVDYAAHQAFYGRTAEMLGLTREAFDVANEDERQKAIMQVEAETSARDEINSSVKSAFGSGKRQIVQRYPSALGRIMEGDGCTPRVWLAQHHVLSWLQGVVVIDERIQRNAEQSTYTSEAFVHKSGSVTPPENVKVKHLHAMGGVFLPNEGLVGLSDQAYTISHWNALIGWLREMGPMVGYVCVHLTILEKFAQLRSKQIAQLLNEIRCDLPRVRIIVVSGRGKPPNLPAGELFMSYSALSQYTTQPYQRTSVALNMLCHSARRIIRNP